ncbi:MAG: ribose 5-phosphate isomerase B [Rhodospirillales bacterium]|nr:ribose 5-phosphate isomerase B [Rhodospirillales bacterium]MBO6786804.1 ribose 5-phosphate isomerase B [Rhodospirillales bacterium]
MAGQTIAIGCDHAGLNLKSLLKSDLEAAGYDVLDLGTNAPDSVDYPDFGFAVAEAIADGRAEKGVLVCGSGIGISIAANRNPAVRAAPVTNSLTAKLARQHNDANVVCFGERLVGSEIARDAMKVFLETEFEGGRHARRVDKLATPQT